MLDHSQKEIALAKFIYHRSTDMSGEVVRKC